jgi:hypothetical protein
MKNKEIVIPILNNTYKVIVCWGDKKFLDKIRKSWFYPKDTTFELPDDVRGRTYSRSLCHPVIVLRGYPHTPDQFGTLAHEATHAVVDIFQKIEEVSYDEVFAASIGAIVREVLKK